MPISKSAFHIYICIYIYIYIPSSFIEVERFLPQGDVYIGTVRMEGSYELSLLTVKYLKSVFSVLKQK